MKSHIIFIKVIFYLLLTCQLTMGQSGQPFLIGEKLNYSTWFNIIKGGESSLEFVGIEEINGISTYHIRSVTESTSFFDRLYKVRDYMDSWIDTSGQFSHRFSKSIREGKYRKKYSVDFDYQAGFAISNKDRDSIPDRVQDGLSMFYYIRTLDLTVGDIHEINLFDNDSLRPFLIKVDRIESVKTPIGDMDCFVLVPYLESGKQLKNKSKVTIYLSTDQQRIPVMISNEARFGSLILKLESVKKSN
ncbi:MAG: DUF3108 domain-containing protein [Candidatus Marinimicrobia bacterium]|nr:DUF3108 domain-containing protein [Candidatus Neomarinimicrobiota bacterium]